MPDLFFLFSPLVIIAFVLWTFAILLMVIDVYSLSHERQQGMHSVWYERPVRWFAAFGITLGLVLVLSAFPMRRFAYPLDWDIILGFIALSLALLTGGIIAALRLSQKKNALNQEVGFRQLAASRPVSIAPSKLTDNGIIPMIFFMVIFLILSTVFSLIQFYTHRTLEQLHLDVWLLLLIVLLILGVIIRSRALNRLLKTMNRQRLMFAAQRWWPVVFVPISGEPPQRLSSPLVLSLKRTVIACYLVLTITLTWYWLSQINAAGGNPDPFFEALLSPCFLLFILLQGLRERVEATTQGLVVTRGVWFARREQQIPWQEARLFTCYTIPGFLGDKATMTYELASPSRTVQWTRVINTHSLFTPWKTESSSDEYHRQTQELCTCIISQTGLQLHELREERLKRREQEVIMAQLRK